MANTKKKTTAPKDTDTSKPLYIAVQEASKNSVLDTTEYVLACIMDGEYYEDPTLEGLRDRCDGDIEENHTVYKVSFVKVGTLQKAKVNFVKEG